MSQGCKCRACANSLQLCQTLCDPVNCSSPGLLCPWDSPGKNVGVSSHSLLQGIFTTLDWTCISCTSCLGRQVLCTSVAYKCWLHDNCVFSFIRNCQTLAASLSIPISPGRDVRLLCLLTRVCCHWRFYPGPSGRCEPCHTVVFICISPDDFASFWWFCPPHEQIRSGTDLSLCLFWVMLQYLLEWARLVQSCPTLCDLMDCSPPGSSVHRIFQARILEWVSISSSKGSSWPRDWTHVSCIGRQILYLLNHQGSPTFWDNRDEMGPGNQQLLF